MKKINSKQTGVQFIFCASPITIDKRAAWGDSPDNFQKGPDGAFLKVDSKGVSHLVQPNSTKTAPLGWKPSIMKVAGHYDKLPIWIDENVINPGEVRKVKTLDGDMEYTITEPSLMCYNETEDGKPNIQDVWVQTIKNIEKNYDLEISA